MRNEQERQQVQNEILIEYKKFLTSIKQIEERYHLTIFTKAEIELIDTVKDNYHLN